MSMLILPSGGDGSVPSDLVAAKSAEFRKSPAFGVFAYLGLDWNNCFPYLESLCAEIAAKHPKLPITKPDWASGPERHTAIDMVRLDFEKALDDAEKWLNANYPTELSELRAAYASSHPYSTCFSYAVNPYDVNHPSYRSAMNHGGSLGQDYFFWNGTGGRIINKTHCLCKTYQFAQQFREKKEKVIAAAEAKRIEEAKRAEEKYERIIEQRVKDRLEAIERQRRFEEEERKRMEIQAQIDAEVERRVRLALGAPPTTKPVEKSVAPSPKVGGGAAMPVPATKPAEPNTLAHAYAKHGIGNVCEVYEPPSPPVINWNVVEVCED